MTTPHRLVATFFVLVSTLFLTSIFAAAQSMDSRTKTIIASGSASIRTKPDAAYIRVKIETREKSVQATRSKNATTVKKIQDQIAALQFPQMTVKSEEMFASPIYPDRVYDQEKQNLTMHQPLGFQVVHVITIDLKRADLVQLTREVSQIADIALEYGATELSNIIFYKETTKTDARQAMAKAVEDALENARALAKGANLSVKETISIDSLDVEVHTYSPVEHYRGGGFGGGGLGGMVAETPIKAGDIEVHCRVQVTCKF
jgi:uncharacterized protein YggE